MLFYLQLGLWGMQELIIKSGFKLAIIDVTYRHIVMPYYYFRYCIFNIQQISLQQNYIDVLRDGNQRSSFQNQSISDSFVHTPTTIQQEQEAAYNLQLNMASRNLNISDSNYIEGDLSNNFNNQSISDGFLHTPTTVQQEYEEHVNTSQSMTQCQMYIQD